MGEVVNIGRSTVRSQKISPHFLTLKTQIVLKPYDFRTFYGVSHRKRYPYCLLAYAVHANIIISSPNTDRKCI